jgi:steroid delta-isomerase-like uncharacterized protein
MKNKLSGFILLTFTLVGVYDKAYSQNEKDNKLLVSKYFEVVINQQKPELLKNIFSEDYVNISIENGKKTRGIKQLYDFLPYLFKAFPDINYTIDQIVAEGDKVVVQATVRGTQKGEFWGYPISNNKINVTEVFFYTVKGGKIVENKRLLDLFQLGKQLKGDK